MLILSIFYVIYSSIDKVKCSVWIVLPRTRLYASFNIDNSERLEKSPSMLRRHMICWTLFLISWVWRLWASGLIVGDRLSINKNRKSILLLRLNSLNLVETYYRMDIWRFLLCSLKRSCLLKYIRKVRSVTDKFGSD